MATMNTTGSLHLLTHGNIQRYIFPPHTYAAKGAHGEAVTIRKMCRDGVTFLTGYQHDIIHSLTPNPILDHFINVDIVDVDVGIAVTKDGHVSTWGSNTHGELGIGHTRTCEGPQTVTKFQQLGQHVVQVASGLHHHIALTSTGDVYTWGSGIHGQLGTNDAIAVVPRYVTSLQGINIVRVDAGEMYSAAVTADGHLYIWGTGLTQRKQIYPTLISLPAPLISLACGDSHLIVITQYDADIPRTWCMGMNVYGQCGIGHNKNVYTPTEIISNDSPFVSAHAGHAATALLDAFGNVYTCGYAAHSRLGHPDTIHRSIPTRVSALDGQAVSHVTWNKEHMCVFVPTRLLSLSTPLISCDGSTPLQLYGIGLYTPSHTALISFRTHETITVDGIYDEENDIITCMTPVLKGCHEALVRVSCDSGKHWSNPLAVHVYSTSWSSSVTLSPPHGPHTGSSHLSLHASYDLLPYPTPRVRIGDHIVDAEFDPITSALYISTPAYEMGEHITYQQVDVAVALDGETWISLNVKYAYTHVTAKLVEPTQVSLAGGPLLLRVNGIHSRDTVSLRFHVPGCDHISVRATFVEYEEQKRKMKAESERLARIKSLQNAREAEALATHRALYDIQPITTSHDDDDETHERKHMSHKEREKMVKEQAEAERIASEQAAITEAAEAARVAAEQALFAEREHAELEERAYLASLPPHERASHGYLICHTPSFTEYGACYVPISISINDKDYVETGCGIEVCAPVVTSISPACGSVAGDTLITIHGSYFYPTHHIIVQLKGAQDTTVWKQCDAEYVVKMNDDGTSTSTIQFRTPPFVPGPVSVSVAFDPHENAATVTRHIYRYYDEYTVIDASPLIASLTGGTLVTLIGKGFISSDDIAVRLTLQEELDEKRKSKHSERQGSTSPMVPRTPASPDVHERELAANASLPSSSVPLPSVIAKCTYHSNEIDPSHPDAIQLEKERDREMKLIRSLAKKKKGAPDIEPDISTITFVVPHAAAFGPSVGPSASGILAATRQMELELSLNSQQYIPTGIFLRYDKEKKGKSASKKK